MLDSDADAVITEQAMYAAKDELNDKQLGIIKRLIDEILSNETGDSDVDVMLRLQLLLVHLDEKTCFNSEFLFHIVPNVNKAVCDSLTVIKDRVLTNSVQLPDENIKLVVLFLKHVQKCLIEEDTSKRISEELNSLLVTLLTLLKEVFLLYKECKNQIQESNVIKEDLDVLFMQSTGLIKPLIPRFNEAVFSTDLVGDMQNLIAVCTIVLELCKLFEDIAKKPPVALWKTYLSILTKHSNSIEDKINVPDVFQYLCKKITVEADGVAALFRNDHRNDQIVLQSLRMFNFSMGMVIALCEKFKASVKRACFQLYQLLLDLYRFTALILADGGLQAEVEKTVLIPIEMLVSHLVAELEFQRIVLEESEAPQSFGNYHYARCNIFLSVLCNIHLLPVELQDSSLLQCNVPKDQDGLSLIEKIFKSFSYCQDENYVPVCLPGVMCQGKPLRHTSFYEHTSTRLCAAITTLPEKYFGAVERALLKNILGQHFWSNLLASDVWAFLGRLESPELCFGHCCCLAELVKVSPCFSREVPWCLFLTFQRLFGFLAKDHKDRFLRLYPVDENLNIWIHLSITNNCYDGISNRVREHLMSTSVDHLTRFENGDANDVTISLEYNKMIASFCALQQLDHNNCVQVVAFLNLIMHSLDVALKRNNLTFLEGISFHVILLTACCIPSFSNDQLLQVLKFFVQLISKFKSNLITIGVVKFLVRLSSHTCTRDSSQNELFSTCSKLMSQLLVGTSWLAFQQALEMFANFCHNTPHTQIMTRFLHESPEMKKIIESFIKQNPWEFAKKQYSAQDLLGFQRDILKSAKLSKELTFSALDQMKIPGSECHVHQDQGLETNDRTQLLITEIGERVEELRVMQQIRKLPAPLREELQRVTLILHEISKSS